jgi:O-antigen/teichoic acid export membrane protein
MITLILRGPAFIGLWMGAQYSQISGTVLIILGIPLVFAFSNRTATAIAFGVEKHKTSAQWAIGEGVANLILSVVLVQRYGIYGVAIGTMIPSLFAQLVLWPGYISKLVGLSRSEVLWKIWAPMFLSSIPFAIATYAVGVLFPARNLPIFIFQVLATLPIFLITIGVVFRAYVRSQILPRFRSLFFAEARI